MARREPPLSLSGIVVAVVFVCFSSTVTIWTGWGLTSCCIDASQLKDAVLVDAEILEIEQNVVSHGDGTRLQVLITYSYAFDGQQYDHTTERIAIVGHDHEVRDKVIHAYRSGETVPCYVAPSRPSLSVFSKSFSKSLFFLSSLFPLAFGTVTILIVTALYRQYRQRRQQK